MRDIHDLIAQAKRLRNDDKYYTTAELYKGIHLMCAIVEELCENYDITPKAPKWTSPESNS